MASWVITGWVGETHMVDAIHLFLSIVFDALHSKPRDTAEG